MLTVKPKSDVYLHLPKSLLISHHSSLALSTPTLLEFIRSVRPTVLKSQNLCPSCYFCLECSSSSYLLSPLLPSCLYSIIISEAFSGNSVWNCNAPQHFPISLPCLLFLLALITIQYTLYFYYLFHLSYEGSDFGLF